MHNRYTLKKRKVMKDIILCIIGLFSIFILISCNNQVKSKRIKISEKEKIISSKIKSYSIFKSTFEDNKQSNLIIKSTKWFGKNGNLVADTTYKDDGLILNFSKYTLNDTKEFNTHSSTYDPNGSIISLNLYSYDKRNRLVQLKMISKDGILIGDSKYKYDNNGNKIEDVMYSEFLGYEFSTKYEYKDNLNETTKYKIDDDGLKVKVNTTTYDEDENESKIVWYTREGKISSISEYKYDLNGNVTSIASFNEDSTPKEITKYVYKYFN